MVLGRTGPSASGMICTHHLMIQALPGEITLEDVISNRRRRVGGVHGAGEPLESGGDRWDQVAIHLTVGTPDAIATTRVLRSPGFVDMREAVRVSMFEIKLTPRAHEELGEDAGLRLLDCRHDPEMLGTRDLLAKPSQLWKLLASRKGELGAVLIPSPDAAPAATVIAFGHWLSAMGDQGMISVKRVEATFDVRDLGLPRHVFRRRSIGRLQHLNRSIEAFALRISELDRIAKAFRDRWRSR